MFTTYPLIVSLTLCYLDYFSSHRPHDLVSLCYPNGTMVASAAGQPSHKMRY